MSSKKLLLLVILLTSLVASCSTPPSSNPNGSNQDTNIEIQITGTESKEFETETIPQQNCTGVADVENSTGKSRTIQYVIEVQNGASVNANGQVGFAGTDIELGATVASQFGQLYGTSETLTRSITVKAKPGTNMQHVIRQVEIWKVGQAKISVGGQQTIIPFKFRSDFAIELVNSQDLGCDTTQNQEPVNIPTATLSASPQGSSSIIPPPAEISAMPLLPHKIEGIGTGIFGQATYSDGSAAFSQQELNTSHFKIQLINPDTTSNGCGTAWYTVNEVWFGSGSKTTLYLNGTAVGELFQGVGKHGYMIPLSVNAGDELCVNPIPSGGFNMNLGADIYYHYDSFCYRGHC
ncbi:MAG: hypothetical protein WA821_14085 [Anaerolineales bacterium]